MRTHVEIAERPRNAEASREDAELFLLLRVAQRFPPSTNEFAPRDLLFGIEPFGFDRFLELVRRAPDGAALLFDALALRLDPRRVVLGEL